MRIYPFVTVTPSKSFMIDNVHPFTTSHRIMAVLAPSPWAEIAPDSCSFPNAGLVVRSAYIYQTSYNWIIEPLKHQKVENWKPAQLKRFTLKILYYLKKELRRIQELKFEKLDRWIFKVERKLRIIIAYESDKFTGIQ